MARVIMRCNHSCKCFKVNAASGAYILTHQPQSLSLRYTRSDPSPWPDTPGDTKTQLFVHAAVKFGAKPHR